MRLVAIEMFKCIKGIYPNLTCLSAKSSFTTFEINADYCNLRSTSKYMDTSLFNISIPNAAPYCFFFTIVKSWCFLFVSCVMTKCKNMECKSNRLFKQLQSRILCRIRVTLMYRSVQSSFVSSPNAQSPVGTSPGTHFTRGLWVLNEDPMKILWL